MVSAPHGQITLKQELEGHYRRLRVSVGGRAAWALNVGGPEGDFYLQRPTIHPLYTPSGVPVTEHGAHNRVHHKGVWIGHAKINGTNCFHDGPGRGWIRIARWSEAEGPNGWALRLELTWENAAGQPIAEEERELRFYPDVPFGAGECAHRLDIRSVLRGSGGGLHLDRDAHAFCGVRVLDCIDEDDGGTVVNSEGHVGEREAMGQIARWVDTTGRVGRQLAGVTLMVHPTSQPQPFFVRSYGTVLANLCLHQAVDIPPGDKLEQRFCVVAHDGPGDRAAIERLWEAFAGS